MDRDRGWEIVDEQRARLADLLETLDETEWERPSLCEGWRVRDVAAHLSLAATAGPGEVLTELVRARGSFDTMIRDASIRRAQRPTQQIVADLRGIVGSRRLAPGTLWRDPLLDILVHAQDLTRPLARAWDGPADGVRETLDWTWTRRFPFFPGRRLRGVRLVATDADWQRGDGPEVRASLVDLMLLSTGRRAGLEAAAGDGVGVLSGR